MPSNCQDQYAEIDEVPHSWQWLFVRYNHNTFVCEVWAFEEQFVSMVQCKEWNIS